eukprot:COSAG02_NODE_1451_length_12556_cov_3.624258_9_plen_64_part_00
MRGPGSPPRGRVSSPTRTVLVGRDSTMNAYVDETYDTDVSRRLPRRVDADARTSPDAGASTGA